MKNVDIKFAGTKAVITIDMSKDFGLSKSNKSIIVATSEGNVALDGYGPEKYFIGLNIYRPAK